MVDMSYFSSLGIWKGSESILLSVVMITELNAKLKSHSNFIEGDGNLLSTHYMPGTHYF